MNVVLILLFGLFSFTANAEAVLPYRCKPLVLEDETIQLSKDKSTIVMIHNRSETTIWMTHPTSEGGAGAGWSSCMASGRWSALALNQKAFKLRCVESRPGHEQHVPCVGVLTLCKWSGVKRPADDKGGNYWAGENQSLDALTAYLEQRGFKIPQPIANEE